MEKLQIVQFAEGRYTLKEPPPGRTALLSIPVIRAGDAGEAVVEYRVAGGTADRCDYDLWPGLLVFDHGVRTASLRLLLFGNFRRPRRLQARTIVLQLQNPLHGLRLGTPDTVRIAILDGDADGAAHTSRATGRSSGRPLSAACS